MKKYFFKVLFFVLVLFPVICFAKIYRPMDALNQIYSHEARRLSAQELQELSLREYRAFVSMETNTYETNPHFNIDVEKPVIISEKMARKMLVITNQNPVVSAFFGFKYDPENRGIGFCFGRAMFIDFYLSLGGVNRASIKKAFVVGPMAAGNITWGWHVTTIVQSVNKSGEEVWLAIDPINWDVLEVTDWYRRMLEMSPEGKLRLYITDAGKFGASPSRYDETAISNPFYNQYFIDMMKWFDENEVSVIVSE